MKAKNLFFGALTCLAFAACSNDDEPIVNGGGAQTEGDAVMAVRISMPEAASTRAWADGDNTTGNHVNGDENEIEISSVVLYFFDAEGNKWGEPQDITEQFTQKEDKTDNEDNTIESACDAFVIFNNIENTPSQVIAVLNAQKEGTEYKKYSATNINTLRKALSEDFKNTTKGGFIMSNAVYKSGENIVYAADCSNSLKTAKTLAEAQEEAKKNPVKIYVERVLARVSVSMTNSKGKYITSEIGETQLGYNEENKIDIVAIPNGWWLDNTAQQSYLMKDLDSYSNTETWWNSEEYKRSYWAISYTGEDQWYASYDYSKYKDNLNDKYCFENTTSIIANKTQLVVAATLYEKTSSEGNTTYNILQLVEHKTVKWKFDDFITNVINTPVLKVKVGEEEIRLLTKDELEAVANSGSTTNPTINGKEIEAWQAKLKVKVGGENVTYYNGRTGEPLSDLDAAQKLLDEEIGAFKYWKDGQTYYFTKVQHYDSGNEQFGVVRNHMYQINVTSITGLGTPVPYNPEDTPEVPEDPEEPEEPEDPEYPTDPENPEDPEDPEDPEEPIDPEIPTNDQVTSMAAEISVLQYRVVKQDVTLDGNHQDKKEE